MHKLLAKKMSECLRKAWIVVDLEFFWKTRKIWPKSFFKPETQLWVIDIYLQVSGIPDCRKCVFCHWSVFRLNDWSDLNEFFCFFGIVWLRWNLRYQNPKMMASFATVPAVGSPNWHKNSVSSRERNPHSFRSWRGNWIFLASVLLHFYDCL